MVIKTSQIKRDYEAFPDANTFIWSLEIGSTFVWQTKKARDECIVVGIDTSTGIRVPLAVKQYPPHRFTRVYEVRNDD